MKSIRSSMGGSPRSNFFSFQDIIMAVTGILIVIALLLALQVDRVYETSEPAGISSDDDPFAENDPELLELERLLARLNTQLQTLLEADRKTESEAELKAQIQKLEARVVSLSAFERNTGRSDRSPSELAKIEAKAAEIIRLREEIRAIDDSLRMISERSGERNHRMLELEKAVKMKEALIAKERAKGKGVRLIRELSDTTKEPIIVDVDGDVLNLMRFDRPKVIKAKSVADFYQVIRNFKPEDQYFVLYFRPDGATRFEEVRQAVKNSGFEVGYDAIAQDTDLRLGK